MNYDKKKTPSVDLRNIACPMAFVRARIWLDKQPAGGPCFVIFSLSPGNEALRPSLEALGYNVDIAQHDLSLFGLQELDNVSHQTQILRLDTPAKD